MKAKETKNYNLKNTMVITLKKNTQFLFTYISLLFLCILVYTCDMNKYM